MSANSSTLAAPDSGDQQGSIGRRIAAIVFFNFIAYLTVGLPLAVVPGFVHGDLGYGTVIAGLAVSIQYLATLLSRAWAGNLCDLQGPKKSVTLGLALCAGSGLLVVLSSACAGTAWLSLAWLFAGRLVLGAGESLVTTGTIAWGIGDVGPRFTGKVISWNGMTTYGALGLGAPLGVLLDKHLGFAALGLATTALAAAAFLLARRKSAVPTVKGARMPFRTVFRHMTPFGLCLALGSVGFGTITAFVTLYYGSRGWDHAALALTSLGVSFIVARLLLADSISRFGGYRVALCSFAVEALGLALIWMADSPATALAGAAVTGFGFALVFPSLGMEAVKLVPASNRGSALGAYALFLDLSLGVTGPVAGVIANHAGYSSVFLFSALSAVAGLGLSQVLAARARRGG